jgi:SPOR domain
MTNLEVIKKISRRAGVNETEAQMFFEAFVNKLYQKFNTGDILKLPDAGFLHLKKIKTPENEKQLNGVIFSETKEVSKNDNIFFLSNVEEQSQPSDLNFSPSFKRMELPLRDNVDRELFIPPSGSELLSFIDAKAENLLNESEIIRSSDKENQFFTIHSKTPSFKVFESFEDISDFKTILNEEKVKAVDPEKFQKVDSITSYLKKEENISTSGESIKSKPITAIKEDKKEPEAVDEKGYSEVRYKRIDFLTEEKKRQSEEKKENQENKKLSTAVPEKEVKPVPVEKKNVIEEKQQVKINHSERDSFRREKQKRARKHGFILFLFTIMVCAAGYFLFRNMDWIERQFTTGHTITKNTLPSSNPVVIDRSYNIPVSYSYQPEDSAGLSFSGIDQSVFINAKRRISNTANEDISENNIPTVPPGKYKEFSNYIFKDGETYFIQVSSWKYLDRAIDHANQLRKEGYGASVERVTSHNGNTYYRVRLGNFSSLDEANKFVQTN